MMATVLTYQAADGATRYAVRYYTPANRQTMKRGFTTKRDAQAYANKVEVDKMLTVYFPAS
jgi:Arm DNA-binding domain